MSTTIEEVNTTKNCSVNLFNKEGIADFEVTGTFKNWQKGKYSDEITVELKNIGDKKFFHLSLCKFCINKKVFEIHVENIDRAAKPQNHSYLYHKSKNEGFIFKSLNPKYVYKVKVLVYNLDPNSPEEYYKICEVNTKDKLDHPKTGNQPFKALGPQPDKEEGNIIIGNP